MLSYLSFFLFCCMSSFYDYWRIFDVFILWAWRNYKGIKYLQIFL